MKKGNNELRDWVNAELAKLGEEKFLLKLYDQYVRKELSDDTKPSVIPMVESHETNRPKQSDARPRI